MSATANSTLISEVLLQGDPDYDRARSVWNGAIDRFPAMIARCRSTAEVAAAVQLGIRSDLEIAVRAGGHSIPGLSVCEGGLMIDLSPMKGLEIDPVARLAKAQPGLLWGEYDAATQSYGLASPGGEISHTGVAGLTLGGGIGWLSRKYGLACDNLVGVELVLADGTVIEVDDDTDAELMWGLRGGGGNFGIVTRLDFRVHPVPPLYAGLFLWPASEAGSVLERYVNSIAEASRDLSVTVAQMFAPPEPFVPAELHFQPAIGVAAMWTGDPSDGPGIVSPYRDLDPAVDVFGLQPYTAIQQQMDASVPHGRKYHLRSEWLGELNSDAVRVLTDAAADMSSPFNQILVRRMGGAISDIDPDATAFRFRDASYLLTIAAGWDDGDPDQHSDWTRRSWQSLRPWTSGGSYVNHLAADEGVDRVREAYGDKTWDRLVALKRRTDPDNVFHLNQNIDPT